MRGHPAVLFFLLLLSTCHTGRADPGAVGKTGGHGIRRLPMQFVPNAGQFGQGVRFRVAAAGYAAEFGDRAVSVVARGRSFNNSASTT